MATKGGQEVGHAGNVADIGKETHRKLFLAETKGHMVSHVICLGLVLFSTPCISQNQLMACTEVPL